MYVVFSQGFEARGTELSDKTVTFMKLHETLKTYGGGRYELKTYSQQWYYNLR